MTDTPQNRRPLKVRAAAWPRALAARLAAAHVSPDAISAASVAFAAVGGALLVLSGLLDPVGRAAALIAAALLPWAMSRNGDSMSEWA